jgi:hypothetical protein
LPRDVCKRSFPLLYAAGRIGLAERRLRTWLMRIDIEDKAAGLAENALAPDEGPSSDNARQRGDVFLGVTTDADDPLRTTDLRPSRR